jgi:hypothetical protein
VLHRHDKAQSVGRGHLATAPASGERHAFCAETSAALAIVSVSARMKFCFTQLSRDRRSAGASRRTSGSKPVFVASATSTAHTLVAMPSALALPSLACVKWSAKPVRACISRIKLGQVEPRQPSIDGGAERHEARRLLDSFKRCNRKVCTCGRILDRHRWIRGHALGRFAEGEFEPRRQAAELLVGRRRYADGAADHGPCRFPRRAGEQTFLGSA